MKNQKTPAQILAIAPLENVIEALEDRCSWPVLRGYLTSKDFKSGLGWADLLDRATKPNSTLPEVLRQTYSDLVVAGSRYVQIYDLDDDLASKVSSYFATAWATPTCFTAAYPLPLTATELKAAPTEPTLCEIRLDQFGNTQLVFCSARITEDRLQIDSETTPDVAAAFGTALGGQYDHYLAFRYIYQQAFDVLTFRPKLRRVEVALDLPQKGMGFDGHDLCLKVLTSAVLMFPELHSVFSSQPTNLFQAIEGIYTTPKSTDFVILDTAFRTPSGAVNRSKMPSSKIDVREEDFHKGGSAAVKNDVRPHGILSSWVFKHPDGFAKIKLWATVQIASSPAKRLNSVEISDCLRDSDITQAINKIVKYL